MKLVRGVLFLREMEKTSVFCGELPTDVRAVECVFDGAGRRLDQAQAALWRLRRVCDWVCVAACGPCSCVAAALAAQLPVDRLALMESSLFSASGRDAWPRDLRRLNAFARRNLSLITSQLVLIAPGDMEARRIVHSACNAQVCIVRDDSSRANLLFRPWADGDSQNME